MLPGAGRQPPHRSVCKLSPGDAAEQRALYPIPGSTEYRNIPESEEELNRAAMGPQSVGRDGNQPPAGKRP